MPTIENVKFGFIGFGNMAGAIAKGLVNSKALKGSQIYASSLDRPRLESLGGELGINIKDSNREVFEEADIVLIGVKPYQVKGVLEESRDVFERRRPALVSIAVNTPFDSLVGELPEGQELLVTIPNLPIETGKGVICCEKNHSMKDETLKLVVEILGKVAEVFFVDLKDMEIVSAVSGCGPAFVAMYIEAMADAAVKHGLQRAMAYRLVSAMVEGSARLQLDTGKHPAQIKDEVCSPGGTTIKGVTSLEANGFRAAVEASIDAVIRPKKD